MCLEKVSIVAISDYFGNKYDSKRNAYTCGYSNLKIAVFTKIEKKLFNDYMYDSESVISIRVYDSKRFRDQHDFVKVQLLK